MTTETNRSSLSLNLQLTEKLTEKLILILISSALSFGSGVVYTNSQTPTNSPDNCQTQMQLK